MVLAAVEAEADVVAFVRDEDDDSTRRAEIESAIGRAKETFPQIANRVAGGIACPTLEAWSLILAGEHRAEEWTKSRVAFEAEQRGYHGQDSTRTVSALIEGADLDVVPHETQFRRWLEQAEQAMARPDPDECS